MLLRERHRETPANGTSCENHAQPSESKHWEGAGLWDACPQVALRADFFKATSILLY